MSVCVCVRRVCVCVCVTSSLLSLSMARVWRMPTSLRWGDKRQYTAGPVYSTRRSVLESVAAASVVPFLLTVGAATVSIVSDETHATHKRKRTREDMRKASMKAGEGECGTFTHPFALLHASSSPYFCPFVVSFVLLVGAVQVAVKVVPPKKKERRSRGEKFRQPTIRRHQHNYRIGSTHIRLTHARCLIYPARLSDSTSMTHRQQLQLQPPTLMESPHPTLHRRIERPS